jgi:PAS domain S-box-containing protein
MQGEAVAFNDFKLVLSPNGHPQEQYFDFSYTPIIDEHVEIRGVSVVCIETTAKVIALQTIRDSEARFRTMAESSDILIAVGDATGNAVFFNKAWVELTGKSELELLEYGWADIIHPDDRQGWLDTYVDGVRREISISGEFRMRNRHGDYRWLMAKLAARTNPDGSFAGYISSCLDITDRQESAEALRQSKEQAEQQKSELAELYERVNIAVVAGGLGYTEVDLATGNMVCNAAFKRCYGRTPEEEFTYPELFESMLPEYREDVKERVTRAKAENKLYEAEYQVCWPDGTIHWINAHGRARYDQYGVANRMVGIVADDRA